MHRHPGCQRAIRRRHADFLQVNRGNVVLLPPIALVLQIDRLFLRMMRPRCGVRKANGQDQREVLAYSRNLILELPGRFGQVRSLFPLVLIRDHPARIASRRIGYLRLLIRVELSSSGSAADFEHFAVFQRELVSGRIDTPDVKRRNFGIFIEGHERISVLPSLRSQNFHYLAHMLGRPPVGANCIDGFVQQNHRPGPLGVVR